MMVLRNLERGRPPHFRERNGFVERSERKRGMLELGIRVYVGPTEWLLKILEETTWCDTGVLRRPLGAGKAAAVKMLLLHSSILRLNRHQERDHQKAHVCNI